MEMHANMEVFSDAEVHFDSEAEMDDKSQKHMQQDNMAEFLPPSKSLWKRNYPSSPHFQQPFLNLHRSNP